MHYLYSENKGADQLCGYREADLRLCFRICKKPVFSQRGSFGDITKASGNNTGADQMTDAELLCAFVANVVFSQGIFVYFFQMQGSGSHSISKTVNSYL